MSAPTTNPTISRDTAGGSPQAEAPPKAATFEPTDEDWDEVSSNWKCIEQCLQDLKEATGCPDSFIEGFIETLVLSDSASWRDGNA